MFPDCMCAVYTLEVDDVTYYTAKNIVDEYIINKDRCHNNYPGLFGVIVRISIGRKSSYFCSQLVASVLKQSNIDLFNKPTGLITPYDFMKSDRLKLIYTVKLFRYSIDITDFGEAL